jgi:D-alanyl-D-alanine carboxypeptidase
MSVSSTIGRDPEGDACGSNHSRASLRPESRRLPPEQASARLCIRPSMRHNHLEMAVRAARRIRGVALAATLVAAAVAATTAPHAPAATQAAPPSLRQLAKRIVDVGVPGAVVLVKDERGTRAGVAGWGNLNTRERFGPDHRFRIGSLTKSFVATVVLQLAAEGVLTLDDAVERWLPGLVPNGGAITLRQLLNHTSGVWNYTDDQDLVAKLVADPLAAWTPEALVAVATSHRPLFAPGSRGSYSNTGYILLGLVVEKASGTPLTEQLRRRIFEPLALTHTSLPPGPALEPPYAHGYALRGNGLIPTPGGRPVDVTAWNPSWAWAAGGIVSTARDIARFYEALLGASCSGRRSSPPCGRRSPSPTPEVRASTGSA